MLSVCSEFRSYNSYRRESLCKSLHAFVVSTPFTVKTSVTMERFLYCSYFPHSVLWADHVQKYIRNVITNLPYVSDTARPFIGLCCSAELQDERFHFPQKSNDCFSENSTVDWLAPWKCTVQSGMFFLSVVVSLQEYSLQVCRWSLYRSVVAVRWENWLRKRRRRIQLQLVSLCYLVKVRS